jgi:hypothetical protein
MASKYYLSIKGNKQGQFSAPRSQIAVSSFQWGGVVGASQQIVIGGNRTETVGASQTISIGGSRTETVGSNQTITVGGGRTETVGSNQTITVGGKRTETVGSNETITMGGAATLTITKPAGAEDSQFVTALVLRERLEIQYGPQWKTGHQLAVATLTSAVVTSVRNAGRLKEITFSFIPHRIVSL